MKARITPYDVVAWLALERLEAQEHAEATKRAKQQAETEAKQRKR